MARKEAKFTIVDGKVVPVGGRTMGVQSHCPKCNTKTYYKPGQPHYSGCDGILEPYSDEKI